MTREDYIHAIAKRSSRYGDLLLEMMETCDVYGLKDITAEQAEAFYNHLLAEGIDHDDSPRA